MRQPRYPRITDPRDPDYDGPEEDEDTTDNDNDDDEPDYYSADGDFFLGDDPADDYIMTERELRGEL